VNLRVQMVHKFARKFCTKLCLYFKSFKYGNGANLFEIIYVFI
jgi:hypothetical protein